MQSNGYTVYSLSLHNNLDRTTLQRMVTGKRLPRLEFVLKFIETLTITKSAKEYLLYLYEIEKSGKERITQRQLVQSLLKNINDFIHLPGEIPQVGWDAKVYNNSIIINAENSNDIYKYLLNTILEESLSQTTATFYTNLPAHRERLFIDILYMAAQLQNKFRIHHKVTLMRKQNETQSIIYNTAVYKTAIPLLCTPYIRYTPYINFTDTPPELQNDHPFPYYFITRTQVLWFSAKLDRMYALKDANHRDFLMNAPSLDFKEPYIPVINYLTQEKVPAHYQKVVAGHGRPDYSIQGFFTPLLPLGISAGLKQYYTLSAIRAFAKSDFAYGSSPFSKSVTFLEVQRHIIREFWKLSAQSDVVVILAPDSIALPLNIYISIFPDKLTLFYIINDNGNITCLMFNETTLCNALTDYMASLECSGCTLSKDDLHKEFKDILENI